MINFENNFTKQLFTISQFPNTGSVKEDVVQINYESFTVK